MGWISNTMDKVEGLLDKAQGFAAQAIVTAAEPRVHAEIDGRVDAFRDATLQALPQQCEERLKCKAEDGSTVAWLFNKVIGDRTDGLVNLLLEKFRPGVTSATDGLSLTATQKIMEQLKDLLDGAEAEAASGGEAAAALSGDAEPVAGQVEQLQVSEEAPPEQLSRSIELPTGDQQQQQQQQQEGGFRHRAFSHVASLAGMAFNVEQRLPGFEEDARALVHPLFESLKAQVWELVPDALQDALGPLVGEKKDDVEANPEEAGVAGDADSGTPEVASRGLSSWIQNKLEGKAGVVLNKVMAAALEALNGPLQSLISRLVDDLESSSMEAAFQQVRQKLADYKLISSA